MMHDKNQADERGQLAALAQRIERIRLPAIELARRTGLNQGTIGAALSGRKPMTARTSRDLRRAVAEEEQALLGHLITLHPDAALSLATRLGEAA